MRLKALLEHALGDKLEQTYPGSEVNLYEKDKFLTLSKIALPKQQRGQGIGSKIMEQICKYADSKGLTVLLSPSTDFGATSVQRLIQFYKQFGFIQNKGRNRDFTHSYTMYRVPKETMNEAPKKGYWLFLDDFRQPRDVYKLGGNIDFFNNSNWVVVKSYNEFISVIQEKGLPERISFDHDLGIEHYDVPKDPNNIPYDKYSEKTGLDCAKWLVNYCLDNKTPFPSYSVHSQNPIGKKNIIGYITSAKNTSMYL